MSGSLGTTAGRAGGGAATAAAAAVAAVAAVVVVVVVVWALEPTGAGPAVTALALGGGVGD